MSRIVTTNKAKVEAVSMDVRLPLMLLVAAILWVVICPLRAAADCRWEWICDESGLDCERGAVCGSVHDVMPPPPSDPQPVVGSSAPPPPNPGKAPEGATDCKQVRRCDIQGNCIWDTLCLCL